MSTFEVYIRNFNRNGSVVTNEELMYKIPMTSPYTAEKYGLSEPKVKCEMGKAGSFEFSIYPDNYYYDVWNQMKTMLRVVYLGNTIFYGRVLTIDVDYLTGKKAIHAEGYLAFLLDAQVEGVADAERAETDCATYLESLIGDPTASGGAEQGTYNWWITGQLPDKSIRLGEVPGHYSASIADIQKPTTDNAKRYGSTSWQDVSSALSALSSEFGGYFRARYENDVVYLDWLCNYFSPSAEYRRIQVLNNVINISSSTEVENIWTMLIPVGKKSGSDNSSASSDLYLSPNKWLRVCDIVDQNVSGYTAADLNVWPHTYEEYRDSLDKFGYIYKMVNFSNAKDEATLRSYAWDFIKNNYHGSIESFTVTALDLAILDNEAVPLLAGDKVQVIYPTNNGTGQASLNLVLISAEYDLQNPQNNSYTIGQPDISLNKTYGKSSDSSKGGSNSASGGSSYNFGEGDETDKKVDHLFQTFILSASENNEAYNKYYEKYGPDAAAEILDTAELLLEGAYDEGDQGAQEKVKRLELSGHTGKITGYSVPSILSEEAKEKYEALQSIVIDASEGALTAYERADLLLGAESSEERKEILLNDFLNTPVRDRAAFQIAMNATKDDEGATVQAPSMKMYAIGKLFNNKGDLVSTSSLSSYLKGEEGTFMGTGLQLGSLKSVADGVTATVGDMANEASQNVLPGIDLNGSTAELTTSITNGLRYVSTMLMDGKTSELIGQAVGLVSDNSTVNEWITNIKNNLPWPKKPNVVVSGKEKKVTISADNANNSIEMNGDEKNPDVPEDNEGTIKVGHTIGEEGWSVTINSPYTYTSTDQDGTVHTWTVPAGSVSAKDIHFTKTYDSLRAKLLVVDALIADYANVNVLEVRNATIDTMQTKIATGVGSQVTTINGDVSAIKGSAIWTNRDHITGIVGEMEFKEDENGNKYLLVKSGGGVKIEKNHTEYGVYDDDTLTAGVVIKKINGDDTEAAIKANKVYISGTTTLGDTLVKNNSGDWVIQGGGLKVLRNGAEFGIYDKGNLNAGIIISKINGSSSETETKILSTKVDLGAYATVESLDATNGAITKLTTGVTEATWIKATTLSGTGVSGQNFTIHNQLVINGTASIMISSSSVAMHSLKIDNTEKAKFLGTEDVNFDRAAARREGAQTMYVSPSDFRLDEATYDTSSGRYLVYVEATCVSSDESMSSITDSYTGRVEFVPTDAINAGKDIMGLSINGANHTITAAENSTKSVTITNEITAVTYNASTHTYLISAQAKANGVNIALATSASDTTAYTEGQKSVDINVDVNKGSWTNNTITFSPSAGTGSSASVALTSELTWSGGNGTLKIKDTQSNNAVALIHPFTISEGTRSHDMSDEYQLGHTYVPIVQGNTTIFTIDVDFGYYRALSYLAGQAYVKNSITTGTVTHDMADEYQLRHTYVPITHEGTTLLTVDVDFGYYRDLSYLAGQDLIKQSTTVTSSYKTNATTGAKYYEITPCSTSDSSVTYGTPVNLDAYSPEDYSSYGSSQYNLGESDGWTEFYDAGSAYWIMPSSGNNWTCSTPARSILSTGVSDWFQMKDVMPSSASWKSSKITHTDGATAFVRCTVCGKTYSVEVKLSDATIYGS